ncbi:MAG: hypothetical protein LW809_03760 [Vampirovibrionales bacterium]|jgi:hypothetical protein|nr:hypothetical protein [Vampirovibrionales bacterium]
MTISANSGMKQVIQHTRRILDGNPEAGVQGILEPFIKHSSNPQQALNEALSILEQNKTYYQDTFQLSNWVPPQVTVHTDPQSFVKSTLEDLSNHGTPEQIESLRQNGENLLKTHVEGVWLDTSLTEPFVKGHMLINEQVNIPEDLPEEVRQTIKAGLNPTKVTAHELTHTIQSTISKALHGVPSDADIKEAFDIGNSISEIRRILINLLAENLTPHPSSTNMKGSSLDIIKSKSFILRQLEKNGEFAIGKAILNLISTEELNALERLFAKEIQAHSNGLRNEALHLPIDNQMIPIYAQLRSMTSKAIGIKRSL